ncbi:uncharacterized protein LOC141608700 [Silene latifolia]|uniref:uncharacterized protein LOC141608700 n=1 Tax=Silene latifolia TaxID=37657 RepID=UPI003D76C5D7
MALKSRRKFGFCDGSIKKPTDDFLLGQWEVVHCTIVSWFRATIDTTVLESVPYVEDATAMWSDLEERFAVVDGTSIHSLKTELGECRQKKGMSVTEYYGKLKSLWDALSIHEPPFACECGKCTCDIAGKAVKRLDNERLHQFFMGLDRSLYGTLRNQQFQLVPLPSLNRGYHATLQAERLLLDETSPDVSDIVAYATPGSSSRTPDELKKVREKEKAECRKLYCSHCEDRSLRKMIGVGELRDGLFILSSADGTDAAVHTLATTGSFELWHRRLGHPGGNVVQFLPLAHSFSVNKNLVCDVCHRAKQTRASFNLSENIASDIFSLIHCDLWGPYRTPSTCGAKYFLTIVDDCSRSVWVYLLLAKTEVTSVFIQFLSMVHTQFSKQVKVVRSDNGTEFNFMADYFLQQGIQFQTSCVGTPQQNGRVERKHRHILNVARALLFQGQLPKKFWGECVLTAAYLINRTPSKLLGHKTPYEILFGVSPSYQNMRIFGCICYTYNQQSRGDKFEPRSRKCIFLGYPHNKKGWKVLDIETGSIFISRDVIFHEELFHQFDDTGDTPSIASADPILSHDDPPEIEHSVPSAAVPDTSATAETITPTEQPLDTTPETDTGPAADTAPSENIGRGHRLKFPNSRLQGYVLGTINSSSTLASPDSPTSPSGTSHALANFVNCNRFSTRHKTFLAAITTGVEPHSFKVAIQDDGWCKAMKEEIAALESNDTWELTELPPNKKALGCRWTLHGISNVAFNDLLQLLRDMVPEAKIRKLHQAKKIVRDLGLDYKKICACPNDCMLYWKEFENAEECYKCHASKWNKCEANSSNKTSKTLNSRRIPAKVLWHFPLEPRLQRVYMNSETAEAMTRHADKRPKDGYLRHPADGLAWKDFDSLFPLFANEPRNVRLGWLRWVQSISNYECISQYMARCVGQLQFATLDVHETGKFYAITAHSRSRGSWE